MKIYLRMTKQWSRSTKPGMIVPFDEAKGRRVIAAGFAVEVPNPNIKSAKAKAKAKAEARAKAEEAKAKVETAMANPDTETADVRPNIKGKSGKKK